MTQLQAATAAPAADIPAIQRRTVRTLFGSQVCGGVGLVSGFSVTALLADDLTGSRTLAGLAASCVSIGAAAASFPLAKLMARSGRRPGLRTGYLIAAIGALLGAMAAITGFFLLLPLGVIGIGVGNATNLASRYAAADLAPPDRRARTIGLIVWATTLGAGLGSLVSLSVLDPAGRRFGLPTYGGSFVAGALLFLVAAVLVQTRLRPDPLVVAGGVGSTGEPRLPFRESMRLVLAHPQARLAVLAMMISQATMVGTMTLTPLHMKDGHQSGTAISIMLFSHILGMYMFSPVVGMLTDRLGSYPMLSAAGALCVSGAVMAGLSPPHGFLGVTVGMTFVGLAWCFGVIAASGLLTRSFPVSQRASVQGAGDLCMAGFGAAAGIAAGGVVAMRSFHDLSLASAGLGVVLILAVAYTAAAGRGGPLRAPEVREPEPVA